MGDLYNLNWVDWHNDRHQDGWLTYMNVGEESWRTWIEGRISRVIDRFGVDAYFLDIVGGHVNSTTGDMHEGTNKLTLGLCAKYPKVAVDDTFTKHRDTMTAIIMAARKRVGIG